MGPTSQKPVILVVASLDSRTLPHHHLIIVVVTLLLQQAFVLLLLQRVLNITSSFAYNGNTKEAL
jgi:hypothetical protein